MAHGPRRDPQQSELYDPEPFRRRSQWRAVQRVARPARPLCAGCRAKEARYGFQEEEGLDRPRTLCFECFRLEIVRRQGSRQAVQRALPLADTLRGIDLRRRRAQIAARRVLGI
jgi:hypothetical protein